MSNKDEFFEILKTEFSPKLRELGFKGSGQNFRRIRGEVVNAVNIQVNKHGGSCALNIGLHLLFLPVNWGNELPDAKKVKELDCEFRTRVAPNDKGDYWWKFGGLLKKPAKSARHLIETYLEIGEPYFERYKTIEDISEMVQLSEFSSDDVVEKFGYITVQRGALAMARVHLHLGNTLKAREYAKLGLKNLGHATSLKGAYSEVVNAT